MTKIIKREIQLFKFFTKKFNNGFSIFLKYNFLNLVWRFFGKSEVNKLIKKNTSVFKFKNNHVLDFPWILSVVSIYLDKEYSKFPEFAPKKGQTVVDFGGNVGVYSYYAWEKVGKTGKILTAEPHPANLKILKKNIRKNRLDNIKIFEAAISRKSGSLNLEDTEGLGSHSINKTGKIKVKALSLDKFLNGVKKVDIMKMDIEGSEVEVLKSPKNVLKKIKKIVLETHDNNHDEVKELLLKNKYKVRLVDNGRIIYAQR